MARVAALFVAIFVPFACNLSLDEGESDAPPGAPPTVIPGGYIGEPQGSTTCGGDSRCELRNPDSIVPSWAGPAGSASSDLGQITSDAGGGVTADAGTCPGATCAERPSVCLANSECTDGLCVNNRCQRFCATGTECSAGDACWLGLCRRGAAGFECFVAEDCPDSDDCVGGSCLRRCLSNEHCAVCDDGPACGVGYCGP
jgi:hypothetical protein